MTDGTPGDDLEKSANGKQVCVERLVMRDDALALYKPPFAFNHGFIFDKDGNMVADGGECDRVARIRGWGRISYMENPEKLQDTVGELIAIALTEYWERNSNA
jgi:hypothetical protein